MIRDYAHAAYLQERHDRTCTTDSGWDSMKNDLRGQLAAQRAELTAERVGRFIKKVMAA